MIFAAGIISMTITLPHVKWCLNSGTKELGFAVNYVNIPVKENKGAPLCIYKHAVNLENVNSLMCMRV